MTDNSGELTIVFNGEVFNYLSLRGQLEEEGAHFRTASDTEVLLEAYRLWGTDCLAHLNGMFAFALYDAKTRRLFMARDRVGEKPLFYHYGAGRFSFASELKALFADPAFPREMDLDALNAYLAYGYVPGDRCIVRGVHKLPAAHALIFDLDRNDLHAWRYWSLPQPASSPINDPEEAVRVCEDLLEESVRLRLIADVPVGVLLSGGIDSSIVTAIAARIGTRPVKTFNVSFPGHSTVDESPYARSVARHFGTDHTELVAEEASLDLLPALARQYDEPIGDHSVIPTFLVCRLIREHATVALGGDGGDELFGGYPHYNLVQRMDRYRHLVPERIRSLVASSSALLPIGTRGRNHLVGFGLDLPHSLAHINLLFDQRSRAQLLGLASDKPEREKAGLCEAGQSALQLATRLDFETTLVDDYLVKVDRASMLSSLEVRTPFLDHRVVEFAFGSLPDSLRADEHDRKILLRQLAARLLPADLDLRRKQGFVLPLDSWLAGRWGDYVQDVLTEADPQFLAPAAVRRLLQGQRRGLSNGNRIFALTMLELWRREYRMAPPEGLRMAPPEGHTRVTSRAG